MRRMNPRADRRATLLVLLAGALAIAVAYGAEHLLGMAPCPLCLWERWPYRIAILLGLLALCLPGRWPRPILWLLLLVLLAAAGLAFLHLGVEQHWWPSPLPECNAPHLNASSFSTLMASLPSRPSKPCDAANYLIPGLPLSFVTMNFLYASLCLVALAAYLGRRTRSTGHDHGDQGQIAG
jgi:disulfide bond formation protein DsbB